jgi:hypothetical protein
VPVRFQLVMDCADPDLLARFWAGALGYELAPVPAGFATWNDFYRELGVPEEELVDGADRISDPEGHGPGVWFHVPRRLRTGFTSTSTPAARGRTRSRLAGGESTRRRAGWPAWAPPSPVRWPRRGWTTTRLG